MAICSMLGDLLEIESSKLLAFYLPSVSSQSVQAGLFGVVLEPKPIG